jgi:hypothetical protein
MRLQRMEGAESPPAPEIPKMAEQAMRGAAMRHPLEAATAAVASE